MIFFQGISLKMASRLFTAEEVLRQVLDTPSDEEQSDFSDESEQDISEHDSSDSGEELQQGTPQEDETSSDQSDSTKENCGNGVYLFVFVQHMQYFLGFYL